MQYLGLQRDQSNVMNPNDKYLDFRMGPLYVHVILYIQGGIGIKNAKSNIGGPIARDWSESSFLIGQ